MAPARPTGRGGHDDSDSQMARRNGDLDIAQDLTHLRREWKAERIAWAIMAAGLLAALAGLLGGSGPLSRARLADPTSQLSAEYNRFERYQSPTKLRLVLVPRAGADGKTRITVDRSFAESVRITHIDPAPAWVEARPDSLVYVLNTGDSPAPMTMTIHYEPERFGRLRMRTGVDRGPRIEFSQLVYP